MSMQPIGLELREREQDGVQTLTLAGELDIASVPALNAAVNRLCTDATKAITLDLSELRFIDSTGLAAIVLAGKLCEQHHYDFALIPGPAPVQRLFELTGLIEVLPFQSDSAGSEGSAPPTT
jgi:anti-sigma B factor antagonist